jgi:hypothetical protein
MSHRKRKARLNALEAEIEKDLHEVQPQIQAYTEKDSSDLFTLDTQGSNKIRARQTQAEAQTQSRTLSKYEKQTQKAVIKHNKLLKLKEYLEKSSVVSEGDKSSDGYDMWAETEVKKVKAHPAETIQSSRAQTKKKSDLLKTAYLTGLSYNPDMQTHTDIIAEAHALELRKQEILLAQKPVTTSMLVDAQARTTTAKDQEFNGDSDEDSDVGSDEETDAEKLPTRKAKRRLTQADKNRKKRRKQTLFEKTQTKTQTQILRGIDSIDSITQQLDAKEAYDTAMRAHKEADKDAAESAAPLTIADVASVPLSDELNGSMRQILPKGSRIVDQVPCDSVLRPIIFLTYRTQVSALIGSGAASAKATHNKRHSKPHAGENIKWFPKYKQV